MIWVIAALWLFFFISIIIIIKKHLLIIKQSDIKLNKNFQRKVDDLEKKYQSKVDILEKELTAKQKELSLINQHCEELKHFGEQQINDKLKLYKDFKYKELEVQLAADDKKQRDTLQLELDKFIASAAETKKITEEEIQQLKEVLDDYKQKRDLINQAILHEKEIQEQKNFYRIILSDADKEDIQTLNTIEMRLRNRESLYKLILDVFYKKPLDDMLNRVLEGKEFCGIYRITNLKTNEAYIGKSTNIKNRFKQHIRTAIGLDGVARTKIHSAMKEFGIDNFSFEVLEKCPKEIYSEREKYWIKFYETNIYGYNIQK